MILVKNNYPNHEEKERERDLQNTYLAVIEI